MNGLELFKQFIKKNNPIFVELEEVYDNHILYEFCNTDMCGNCVNNTYCELLPIAHMPLLTVLEFEKVKEEYPEYFV